MLFCRIEHESVQPGSGANGDRRRLFASLGALGPPPSLTFTLGNAMNSLRVFGLVSMFLATCWGQAQTNAARPRFDPDQAITVASNLSLGMREHKVIELLESRGLKAP